MFYVTYPLNIKVHRSLYLNMFTTVTEEKALFLLINHRDGIVIERSPRSGRSWVRSPTVSYRKHHKMVLDKSLLSAQHIMIGLASLSYKTSFTK